MRFGGGRYRRPFFGGLLKKFPFLIGIFVGAARVVRQLTYHVTSRRFGDQSAPLDAIGRLLAS